MRAVAMRSSRGQVGESTPHPRPSRQDEMHPEIVSRRTFDSTFKEGKRQMASNKAHEMDLIFFELEENCL